MRYTRLLHTVIMLGCVAIKTEAQCPDQYSWAKWDKFNGNSARGTIIIDMDTTHVTMTTNYVLGSTNQIYGYTSFDGFKAHIPDSLVPATWWPDAKTGVTTMCFDKTVQNPVLLIATLGDNLTPVKLRFSVPYQLLYIDSGVVDHTDTTLTGQEGYAVLLFPGSINCVSIYADTTEHWTNLTWALNPLLFQVTFTGSTVSCDSVTLTANGGTHYYWNGGASPGSNTNTFFNSGTYSVTAANMDGCQVTASETVTINRPASTLDASVCAGQSYLGHATQGTFVDTLMSATGCDSIRTLHLSVVTAPKPNLGEYQMVCTGDTLYITPGKFDTYTWQDGSSGESFMVTSAGTYSVTVTNMCGSKNTEAIITEQKCIINFPNAFTPNNDGKNDQFKILNAYNVSGYHLTIFNRWGQMLFESGDYSKGWDGKFKGVDQDQGVYVFFCEYNKNGVYKEFRGTVTLLR